MTLDRTVNTGLLAVVQMIDGCTGRTVDDPSASFQLDGLPCEPVRKGNGFYVFTNLPDVSPHRLAVTCSGFIDVQTSLTAISLPLTRPLSQQITVIELGPSPYYAYPVGTTLVCGQVTSGDTPLGDAEVFALFADSEGTWHWRRTLSYGQHRDSAYFGHYTLPLPAMMADSAVSLRFAKDGHAAHFDRVAPARAKTTIVGASLQPANA